MFCSPILAPRIDEAGDYVGKKTLLQTSTKTCDDQCRQSVDIKYVQKWFYLNNQQLIIKSLIYCAFLYILYNKNSHYLNY